MVTETLIEEVRLYLRDQLKTVSSVVCRLQDSSKFMVEEVVESYVNSHRQCSFSELLFDRIRASGAPETDIYKRAGIDRRLFSKIRADRSGKRYHPGKPTVIALSLALHLDLKAAEELLQSAGYSLSKSSRSDLIIRYCITHAIYDLFEVNEILDRSGESAL
jgi:hypothetical protein